MYPRRRNTPNVSSAMRVLCAFASDHASSLLVRIARQKPARFQNRSSEFVPLLSFTAIFHLRSLASVLCV